MKLYETAVKVN